MASLNPYYKNSDDSYTTYEQMYKNIESGHLPVVYDPETNSFLPCLKMIDDGDRFIGYHAVVSDSGIETITIETHLS